MKGLPVSPGIVFGKAFLINDEGLVIPRYISSFDLEQARLGQALQSLKEKAKAFDSYLMVLEDPNFQKQTLIKIRDESINAEWALKETAAELISASILHPEVLHDITSSLISLLLKDKKMIINKLVEPIILVAPELTIIQIAAINPKNILGILAEREESSTAMAIWTRNQGIPAIVGLQNITSIIKNGDQILCDGEAGTIIINPSNEDMNY